MCSLGEEFEKYRDEALAWATVTWPICAVQIARMEYNGAPVAFRQIACRDEEAD